VTIFDRKPSPYELDNPAFPLPPQNGVCLSPFQEGMRDLRWDDPALLTGNSRFTVLGVNVYRSDGGEFYLVSPTPSQALFFRDQAQDVAVVDEVVTGAFLSRMAAEAPVLQPAHWPITRPGTRGKPADRPEDVVLRINGAPVRVARVVGDRGMVYLDASTGWDIMTQQFIPPVLPGPGDVVTLSYGWTRRVVPTEPTLRRVSYKLTTVASSGSGTVETPLADCQPLTADATEQVDWIWREAMRRNRWILGQGGEFVKVFLRKAFGSRCSCWQTDYKQAENDHPVCFGTGWVGGYDGPYEMIIGPPEGPRTRRQEKQGLKIDQRQEVWTGATPLLCQRDFIVRQNGDRFGIGAITIQSARGNILQQHFEIAVLPEKDVRYRVPVTGTTDLAFPQTRLPNEFVATEPMVTDRPGWPAERERRGRTVTFENVQRSPKLTK